MIPNLSNKNKYVVHYRNLVYGKTVGNLRKRINVRFLNNKKDFLKYTSRPTYVTHKLFNKNFAAIHEIKPVLILNKPIYVGFTVLDLSKWLMYDFHYNFIKKNFSAELLFTDTDSLTYDIKSENVYKEFYQFEIDKIYLSCFDDKRYVLDNGVNTLAYFHKYCKKCDKINDNKDNKDQ